ncbi:hypothetical protein OPT61_g10636 [Boeremia exigua]|uniref:Uncharacterized protein n=1 Tax=Boeremia exigua TaxID=749465 RepID=A0ACC2HNM1_9PLEO|nr:hypothetical protein OPT61_g10636 [Boeremia exigua]
MAVSSVRHSSAAIRSPSDDELTLRAWRESARSLNRSLRAVNLDSLSYLSLPAMPRMELYRMRVFCAAWVKFRRKSRTKATAMMSQWEPLGVSVLGRKLCAAQGCKEDVQPAQLCSIGDSHGKVHECFQNLDVVFDFDPVEQYGCTLSSDIGCAEQLDGIVGVSQDLDRQESDSIRPGRVVQRSGRDVTGHLQPVAVGWAEESLFGKILDHLLREGIAQTGGAVEEQFHNALLLNVVHGRADVVQLDQDSENPILFRTARGFAGCSRCWVVGVRRDVFVVPSRVAVGQDGVQRGMRALVVGGVLPRSSHASARAVIVALGTYTDDVQHVGQIHLGQDRVPHGVLRQDGIDEINHKRLLGGMRLRDGGFEGGEDERHGHLGQVAGPVFDDQLLQHLHGPPVETGVAVLDGRTVFEGVQERHDGGLADVGAEEVGQGVPGAFFECGNLPMDCTEHLKTGLDDAERHVDEGDDGVEELDAVFHVDLLGGVLADVHDAVEDLLQVVVGEDAGVELADVGGVVEDAPQVLRLLQRAVDGALAGGLAVGVEGIAAGAEAGVEGVEQKRHDGGLAGGDVLPARVLRR